MRQKVFIHVPGPELQDFQTYTETAAIAKALEKCAPTDEFVFHHGFGRVSGVQAAFLQRLRLAWFRLQGGAGMMKKSGATAGVFLGIGANVKNTPILQGVYHKSGSVKKSGSVSYFSSDPVLAEKFSITWVPGFCVSGARMFAWEEKEQVKAVHTEGKEFFLTSIDEHDDARLKEMLKAYTLFKKRQRTGTIWFFIGSLSATNRLKELSKDYLLRGEMLIKTIESTEERLSLTASAYALIHLPTQANWLLPVHDAIASGTPCILPPAYSILAGAQGFLAAPPTHPAIAEAMKTMFKDENTRSLTIKNAAAFTEKYGPEHTLRELLKAF